MSDNHQITDTKEVWLVFANTDNTEGRGHEFVKHICESEATAIRLGKGGYVQGGNCPITKSTAFKIQGRWMGPISIVPKTSEDTQMQDKLNAKRAAYQKAIAAGMTAEELLAMGVKP